MDPAARASLLKQAVSADKPGEPSSAQPAMQLVNGRRSYGDCYMQLGCRKYDDLSVTESFCSGCKTPAHLVCLSLHPADGRSLHLLHGTTDLDTARALAVSNRFVR